MIAKSEGTEEVGARRLKHQNPQFWVFDLKWEKPYGPLDSEEFSKLKAQKGIDLELVPYDKRIKGEEHKYD